MSRDADKPRVDMTQGRNERCACGSGKKFKNCHLLLAHEEREREIAKAKAEAPPIVADRRPSRRVLAALIGMAAAVTPTK